jgi:hypothetical protein
MDGGCSCPPDIDWSVYEYARDLVGLSWPGGKGWVRGAFGKGMERN